MLVESPKQETGVSAAAEALTRADPAELTQRGVAERRAGRSAEALACFSARSPSIRRMARPGWSWPPSFGKRGGCGGRKRRTAILDAPAMCGR